MEKPRYKRVVLKISGEALAGNQGFGLQHDMLVSVAEQVAEIRDMGVEVSLVVGGGTYGVVLRVVLKEWIVPKPITWAC